MNFNDRFYPTPLGQLLSLILKQLEKGEVLGLTKELFFEPKQDDFFNLEYLGKKLDNPIGVAAGPQTQLAQNIVISWLVGARFIELKTVQTLDELEVSKPCIDMQDEGYNCEWSQELKINKAFDEYLNAWIIIHILKDKLGYNNIGTIFNMSVGYDLQGIMKPNVQWFFNKMNDATAELNNKIAEIENIYPNVKNLNIPAQISDNITLSTMHGCPPEEVEQIANYLIKERKLNTTIKLNPTLLGSEKVHEILRNSGFKTNVPFAAFEHDLKYEDALGIITRLSELAKQNEVFFGIKLTNTLESTNNKDVFGKENAMMYMSGKALHPISINLAKKIQSDFIGELPISFSGGADAFNIADVVSCGLKPITVSTDLLKPGGYGRLHQYVDNLRKEAKGAKTTAEYINQKAGNKFDNFKLNALENLHVYADKVLISSLYKREGYKLPSIKTNKALDKFDCISAPCMTTCPTNQNVPQYMFFTQIGNAEKALKTVLDDNPFPTVTGYICDHICQQKCTRINYDSSVNIRDVKRFISETATYIKPHVQDLPNKAKVAIIGAGPGGLSAAYYLLIHGFEVEIFERNEKSGGMLSNALPTFRLPDEQIDIDIKHITELGVKINYEFDVDFQKFEKLKENFEYIFVAPGAQASLKINTFDFEIPGVYDPIRFFYKIRNGYAKDIGKKVAIVGGGNTAMDAARIAKRLVGKDGEVYIFYRRTKEFMPADYKEMLETVEEGVKIIELVDPEEVITDGRKVTGLKLIRTQLVRDENGGRPRPVNIPGSSFEMEIDAVIPALGQENDFMFLHEKDYRKREIPFTRFDNIFIGGDAVRGAASAIKAISDGKKTAYEIIKRKNPDFEPEKFKFKKEVSVAELKVKKATRIEPVLQEETPLSERDNFKLISKTYTAEQAKAEADRCLLCDEICDVCVSVCPNLANQSYNVEPLCVNLEKITIIGQRQTLVFDQKMEITQNRQTYNIADWCNECGNCATFCPTSGKPYLDKPKVHLTKDSFSQSPFGYFIENNDEVKLVKYKDGFNTHRLKVGDGFISYENEKVQVDFDENFKVLDFHIKKVQEEILLRTAFDMYVLSHITN
ncbi:MAG: putative selenate reductase subunit YgfK [Bacteroidales bacterium]|nr:putative selenate reductase subunit YgfK [Bacteroidales bacterium]